MVKLSPAGRRWTSSRRFETSMPTKTGALSMTRFRWMRADQPWPPFGLRGHGRRGARYLPGLAGPMGKRAPAGLPDPDTYRIGSRQHTNGQVSHDGRWSRETAVLEDADAPVDVAAGVLRPGA